MGSVGSAAIGFLVQEFLRGGGVRIASGFVPERLRRSSLGLRLFLEVVAHVEQELRDVVARRIHGTQQVCERGLVAELSVRKSIEGFGLELQQLALQRDQGLEP
jgi:hypothetical protein